MIRVFFLPCLCLLSLSAFAQPLLPAQYKSDIPTLENVLGHESGAEITTPDEAIAYLEALQAAVPAQMRIERYAQSWEGRDLVYAVIAAEETMARLETVKADLSKLAAGTLNKREQTALAATTPAVVWLAYGVHGDEISSTDASLALAYHLLAAQGDSVVSDILANTIIIIDPMQNPDGRNRFVNTFEAARGLVPQGDRYAAEHDQPWPGGRPNHYLFDLNRDWFTLSQPETRGKVAAMQGWSPVVVADVHEMGGDQTYFFPPAAQPFNPGLTDTQIAKQDLIGRNHARWFDGEGIEYFTREVFDAFYPGYGDMWPALNGAIAMTYEQGSSRGLIWDRTDDRTLTYRDGVRAHFLASLSTAQTVAQNKARFLEDYADFRSSAIAEGARAADRYYVFDRSKNTWQAERMARQLAFQGISVQRLNGRVDACGASYTDGALVVDLAQPAGRLAKTLLAAQTDLPADFVKEQENRRDRGLDAELYDVTAWSVPLMSGVAMKTCARFDMTGAQAVMADELPEGRISGASDFGYAVPWTDAGQARLVIGALSAGFTGKTADEAFTIDGRTFSRGTVIFSRKANEGKDLGALEAMAREYGAELSGLASSWTREGPNPGSDKFQLLKLPRVALAWGDGASSLDAGAARYVLEQSFGLPVTPIRVGTLPRADLGLYDVLIFPSGQFGGEALTGAVKEYVEEGGVVIGFGSALRYLSRAETGLLSTKVEAAWVDPELKANADNDESEEQVGTRFAAEADYRAAIDVAGAPDDVPGVLLNMVADKNHWLSAGYETGVSLLTGSDIYAPLLETAGTNVFHYAGADDILASGYLWEENGKQLAFKPYLMAQPTGNGLTIGFTQSPVTRAYLDGLNLVLLNAVLFGPAHTR